jgi:hypothetical protein
MTNPAIFTAEDVSRRPETPRKAIPGRRLQKAETAAYRPLKEGAPTLRSGAAGAFYSLGPLELP